MICHPLNTYVKTTSHQYWRDCPIPPPWHTVFCWLLSCCTSLVVLSPLQLLFLSLCCSVILFYRANEYLQHLKSSLQGHFLFLLDFLLGGLVHMYYHSFTLWAAHLQMAPFSTKSILSSSPSCILSISTCPKLNLQSSPFWVLFQYSLSNWMATP